MPDDLAQRLHTDGRTLDTVAAWVRSTLDVGWRSSWEQQLPAVSAAWAKMGEPAYGFYNRGLFAPIQDELAEQGLTCDPALPGSLKLSEEEWGPEDFRERRMWTLLVDERPEASPIAPAQMGALVTRFFHDHTELRLPAPPSMVAVAETDHDRIRELVVSDPAHWATRPPHAASR